MNEGESSGFLSRDYVVPFIWIETSLECENGCIFAKYSIANVFKTRELEQPTYMKFHLRDNRFIVESAQSRALLLVRCKLWRIFQRKTEKIALNLVSNNVMDMIISKTRQKMFNNIYIWRSSIFYGESLSCLCAGEVDWQLTSKYLRHRSFYSAPPCLNASLPQLGTVLSKWMHARVTPLLKKGMSTDMDNYRPI